MELLNEVWFRAVFRQASDPWFVPADMHLTENAWAVGHEGCMTAHLSHFGQ
jgi:hypothetical protein